LPLREKTFHTTDATRYNCGMCIVLTRDQVRSVDRAAIDEYGITGLVLMENAGLHAAELIDRAYGPNGAAYVLCGPGNNGGDGCVIARHLHNAEWDVRVVMTGHEGQMTPDALANFHIVRAMGLKPTIAANEEAMLAAVEAIRDDHVVVDALLGTGFRGAVRSPTAGLIAAVNAAAKRATVAIDVPSGLDCDTGEPSNATIHADLTVTFVAQKAGFAAASALRYVGRIEVADIGAPRELVFRIAAEGA